MSSLRHIDLFSGLSTEEFEAIEALTKPRHYAKNTIIIAEGDEPASLYVLVSGSVTCYVSDSDGKEFILDTLDEGDYFGELSLIDNSGRGASIRTREACQCLVIQRPDFLNWLEEYPSISPKLMLNLVKRIRVLSESVKSLALKDVYGRIRALLYSLSQQEGDARFAGPITQQEIANRVGASREMVARILKDLSTGQYIRVEKKKVYFEKDLPDHY